MKRNLQIKLRPEEGAVMTCNHSKAQQEKERLTLLACPQLSQRDCPNSANEKPLYFELSIPPVALFTLGLPASFSLIKKFSSSCWVGFGAAHYGYRLQVTILS